MYSVGDNIKRLRNIFGLTQDQLAEILGVSRESVGRWESDKMAIRDRHVARLVEVFGIEPDDITSATYGLERQYSDWITLDLDFPWLGLAEQWKKAYKESKDKFKLAYNNEKLRAAVQKVIEMRMDDSSQKQANKTLPKGFMPINPVGTVPIPVVGYVHAGQPIDYEEVDYTLDVPQSIIHHEDGYYGCIVEGDCMDRVYPEGCLVVVDTHKEPSNGSIGAFEIDGYQVVMRRVHRGANTLILSPESYNAEHKDLVFFEDSETTVEAIGTVVWFQAREELE